MKSMPAKSIRVLLALVVLAAALAPVCIGAENCSMPCCRPQAQAASHPADTASDGDCCPQTAEDSADNLSGCRFVKTNAALASGAESVPGVAAAAGTLVFNNPIEALAHASLIGSTASRPPGPAIYLRLQALLI